jgi:hypothetical protein
MIRICCIPRRVRVSQMESLMKKYVQRKTLQRPLQILYQHFSEFITRVRYALATMSVRYTLQMRYHLSGQEGGGPRCSIDVVFTSHHVAFFHENTERC